MDDLIIKYAFTYGPLMMFFLSAGWAVKTYAPPLFAAWSAMLRETVAALNSASDALKDSAKAIEANTDAMSKHHETVMVMNRFWETMQSRLENLECQVKPKRRRASSTSHKRISVRIQRPKNADAQ